MSSEQTNNNGFKSKRLHIFENNDANDLNIQISQEELMNSFNVPDSDRIEINSETSIIDQLMKSIKDKEISRHNDNNDDMTIQKIIYACWCSLRISKEKIKNLYQLVSDIISFIAPNHEKIKIPARGQDVIRKFCNSVPEKPQSRNIYLCSECNNIIQYNSGRRLLNEDSLSCSTSSCNGEVTKITFLPLISRIKYLLSSKELIEDISYYTKQEIVAILGNNFNSSVDVPAYMKGNNFKRSISEVFQKGDIFLTFNITCDGVSMVDNGVADINKTSFPVLVQLLNYNKNRNLDKRVFWSYSVVNENQWKSILKVLVEEFKELQKGVIMDIWIQDHYERQRVVCILNNVHHHVSHVGIVRWNGIEVT
ncbi:hypothetical protein WA158_003537 [Blastocystis sp. Blastoise]